MTDPRGVHATHLDAATIAALVDRTLDPAARAAAEAHLAACADCREVWMETSDIASDTEVGGWAATPVPVRPPVPGGRSRRWIYSGAGLAAAIVIGAVAWLTGPDAERERALKGLQAESATHRFAAGRLSTPFSYLPPPQVQRGTPSSKPPASVQRSALLLQELADDRSASALHAAGVAHLAVGDAPAAVATMLEAVDAAPGDAAVRSDLSVALLERWRASGDASDAVRAVDEAKRAAMLDESYAPARFNLALAFEALGLTSQARSAFQEYLRLDSDSSWAEEARQRSSSLAEEEGAVPSLSSLYRSLESEWLPAWGTAVLAGAQSDVARLRGAHDTLAGRDGALGALIRAALSLDEYQPETRTCIASAAAALGEWAAAFESGNSEQALAVARRARFHLECAGLPSVDLLSREATSLLELNRLAEAESVALAILDDSTSRPSPRARARAFQAVGLIAQQQARFSDAIDHAASAVQEARLSGDLEFTAALQTHLSALYGRQGDTTRAWLYLRDAFAGEATTHSLRRRYSIFGRAMMQAIEVGLPSAAVAFADAMLERTDGWDNPLAHAVAHLKRAEMLTRMGMTREGTRALDAARGLIPRVASERVRSDLQAQADLTEGLLHVSPESGIASLTRAVEYFSGADNQLLLAPALLARGRVYARAGDRERAEADWRRGVGLVDAQRAGIRDGQLQISRVSQVWELFEELTSLVAESRPQEALEIVEGNRARQLLTSISRTHQISPLQGTALFDWLPEDTDALVYSALPDRLLIWHLTNSSMRLSSRRVSLSDLNAQVASVRASLEDGSPRARSTADGIPLLPPGFQPRRTLLVIPDGPLHRMPFATLRLPDGQRLIERTTLVIGPSLTTARAARAHDSTPAAPHKVLVAVGTGDEEARLPPLPGAVREVAALASLFPDAKTLLNESATPSGVEEALRTHSLLHFAGHAVTDSIYPNRSYLVLAGPSRERYLTSEKIATLRMRPGTTVVLGACDTANGEIYRGEGAIALSRAFLAGGAGTVVAALWKLNDDDSRRFMVEFHQHLTTADSPAVALQRTQQAWIRAGGAPSVWASFQVTGALPRGRL